MNSALDSKEVAEMTSFFLRAIKRFLGAPHHLRISDCVYACHALLSSFFCAGLYVEKVDGNKNQIESGESYWNAGVGKLQNINIYFKVKDLSFRNWNHEWKPQGRNQDSQSQERVHRNKPFHVFIYNSKNIHTSAFQACVGGLSRSLRSGWAAYSVSHIWGVSP